MEAECEVLLPGRVPEDAGPSDAAARRAGGEHRGSLVHVRRQREVADAGRKGSGRAALNLWELDAPELRSAADAEAEVRKDERGLVRRVTTVGMATTKQPPPALRRAAAR